MAGVERLVERVERDVVAAEQRRRLVRVGVHPASAAAPRSRRRPAWPSSPSASPKRVATTAVRSDFSNGKPLPASVASESAASASASRITGRHYPAHVGVQDELVLGRRRRTRPTAAAVLTVSGNASAGSALSIASTSWLPRLWRRLNEAQP